MVWKHISLSKAKAFCTRTHERRAGIIQIVYVLSKLYRARITDHPIIMPMSLANGNFYVTVLPGIFVSVNIEAAVCLELQK
jgi:hypothetical protein